LITSPSTEERVVAYHFPSQSENELIMQIMQLMAGPEKEKSREGCGSLFPRKFGDEIQSAALPDHRF
jgi:hypothetical protein